ncbi:hypothetical protein FAIPA1_100106 [Frankia sp. AiPs1]
MFACGPPYVDADATAGRATTPAAAPTAAAHIRICLPEDMLAPSALMEWLHRLPPRADWRVDRGRRNR